jgi:hypothetical protein
MCRGDASRTVPPMSLVRGGGLRFLVAAILAFACICLLVDSPLAQGASDTARAASKAKRSKACKKKRKGRNSCTKRRSRRVSLPAGPRTVTATWDSTADIDLQVYDVNGHHAGLEGGTIVNEILGATHSGNDTDGFGPEIFDDPSGRRVGYLACYVSGPYANVTLIDSGHGGGRYTAGLGPTDPGRAYSTAVGWGYLPIGAHC